MFSSLLPLHGTEQNAIAGHVWVLSGLRLGCAHTKRKAPCNPKAPGQTQHLNPTQPANPRPWESTLVSLSLGLGGELGHFGCYLNRSTTMCTQTRREHRCNLISRSISSTEGGITLLKASPRTQQGIFFNFQIVRTIITAGVFPKSIQVQSHDTSTLRPDDTVCGADVVSEKKVRLRVR